jgi:hypothetical protein
MKAGGKTLLFGTQFNNSNGKNNADLVLFEQ